MGLVGTCNMFEKVCVEGRSTAYHATKKVYFFKGGVIPFFSTLEEEHFITEFLLSLIRLSLTSRFLVGGFSY